MYITTCLNQFWSTPTTIVLVFRLRKPHGMVQMKKWQPFFYVCNNISYILNTFAKILAQKETKFNLLYNSIY